jgi:hypothetical protein
MHLSDTSNGSHNARLWIADYQLGTNLRCWYAVTGFVRNERFDKPTGLGAIRKEYIMDRQYLELFKQLIRLKTTHAPENLSAHDRCRDLLKAEAEKRGLKTRIIPSAPYPSLLAGLEVEGLNPALMLSCHLDVVQAQDEQFEPQIKGSRMIGRGTSDMKFAAPVFFNVWDRLLSGQQKILLAFTFDEEIGGNKGIGYLLNEVGLKPEVCFLPDGGDNFQIEAEEKGVFLFHVKTSVSQPMGPGRGWVKMPSTRCLRSIRICARNFLLSTPLNNGPTP